MPKQKDLKRVVRTRMEKTGESYTSARRQIVAKKAEPKPDYGALAGQTDEVIEKQTGRTWSEWVKMLDAFGGREKPHRDVAEHVHSLGVRDWWAQTVTVGYERIVGLRQIGQRRSGTWEASKSRTFAVPVDVLFAHFADARKRRKWLGDVAVTVRKATAPKSMRVTWDDGTSVEIGFYPKGEGKSSVAIQHTKLASKEDVAARKKFWGERFDALGELLEK